MSKKRRLIRRAGYVPPELKRAAAKPYAERRSVRAWLQAIYTVRGASVWQVMGQESLLAGIPSEGHGSAAFYKQISSSDVNPEQLLDEIRARAAGVVFRVGTTNYEESLISLLHQMRRFMEEKMLVNRMGDQAEFDRLVEEVWDVGL